MSKINDRAAEILVTSPAVHLATLMATSGHPKVDPVWVDVEGDYILVATDEGTIKAQNIAADARVALSATATDDPYEQVLIRGRVVQVRDDNDLEMLDRLSVRHLGRPFPRRKWGTRIALVVKPTLVRHYRSPLSDLAGDAE